MTINGLFLTIDATAQHIGHLRASLSQQEHPQSRHDVEVSIAAKESSLATLTSHAQSNTTAISQIEEIINYLRVSSHQSADRILARRELENASMRLRRELGDTI